MRIFIKHARRHRDENVKNRREKTPVIENIKSI
jgi:hypothetical protein